MPELTLTLRTLLAYLDDTLDPEEARALGKKVSESDAAKRIIERIKRVTRRRGLTAPVSTGDDDTASDPNTVAEYLSDTLDRKQVNAFEEACLDSDVHLAEVSACHQILTLVLTEPVRVPPSANQRMYKLVGAPASDPHRKPGRVTPVGGVAPADTADSDDPDAALLLGMKRYGASESWAGRLGLVASVAGIAAFLAVAVLMALPQGQPERPDISTGAVALAPVPAFPGTTPGGPSVAPEPKPGDGGKKGGTEPVEPKEPKKPDPDVGKKDKEPDPGIGGPKPADFGILAGNEPVGRLESKNVAVLTRASDPGAKWVPLEAGGAKGTVRANDVVLALPGYKADVRLDSGVVVHLWANTPEQVSLQQPIMHTRVRFHPVAGGRDADLSIDAGRVYVTAEKDKAKVRLRVGTEVWDVELKEGKAEVLVQANTAFVPGTPFARKDGEPARTEARLVVLQGTVDFNAPKRFKASPGLTGWKDIIWDSKSNKLAEPTDLAAEKRKELHPSRSLDLEGEYGKAIQRVLSAEAREVAEKGVRVALKELINREPPVKFFERQRTPPEYVDAFYPVQLAAYSQAAIAEGTDSGEMLGDLIDMLRTRDLTRFFARQAAVVALSGWIGRVPENTDILMTALRDKEFLSEHVQLIAALLRGYGSPAQGGADALDQLVGFLDHEQVTVREAALGNLLAFFDPGAASRPDSLLVTDVALRKAPEGEIIYPRFLNAWKERAEELKKMWNEKK